MIRATLVSVSICLLLIACTRSQSVTSNRDLMTHGPIETGSTPPSESAINRDSYLAPTSVAMVLPSGQSLSIGASISDEIRAKSNTTITTSLLGVPFGPISGFVDADIRIGWNNRDHIVYIEALSNSVSTFDGIRIGSTRTDVISTMGNPYVEGDSVLRYQNSEAEVIGILFLLNSARNVSGIILFAYV
jgi:hypothetical protein